MGPEHDHHPDSIRRRLKDGAKPNYLRDFVYGGIDGAVTTFAVISGVAGAGLSPRIVVILGLANIVADGFSMAASNYSGTKSEIDDAARLAAIEARHIHRYPEGEREELRQILAAKGLTGPALESAVEAISSNERTWIDTMLVDEYGLAPVSRSPAHAALATFLAFMVCGLVPLVPYLMTTPAAFEVAAAATGAVFFAIGAMKSRWSLASWWRSGTETFAIGMAAAAIAYVIGYLLREAGMAA